jgi:hypothetical protein
MFDFRLIECADGTQVIDTSLKTPYNALTPVQMVEYTEVDANMAYMERMKKQQAREADKRKTLRYRLACMFGLIG